MLPSASRAALASPIVLCVLVLLAAGCGGDAMESVTYTADNAPVVYRPLPDSATVYPRSDVDRGPEIDGGRTALIRQIDYPSQAFDDGVEGVVRVSLVVGPNGLVYEPDVLASVAPAIDREALRALQGVTWTPGRANGAPAYVQTEMAVPFRLADHQSNTPSRPAMQQQRPPRYR